MKIYVVIFEGADHSGGGFDWFYLKSPAKSCFNKTWETAPIGTHIWFVEMEIDHDAEPDLITSTIEDRLDLLQCNRCEIVS